MKLISDKEFILANANFEYSRFATFVGILTCYRSALRYTIYRLSCECFLEMCLKCTVILIKCYENAGIWIMRFIQLVINRELEMCQTSLIKFDVNFFCEEFGCVKRILLTVPKWTR